MDLLELVVAVNALNVKLDFKYTQLQLVTVDVKTRTELGKYALQDSYSTMILAIAML